MNVGNDLAFGPVPSRRLGRSLGINNIPPKVCSYSCVYCQLGFTRDLEASRRDFYPPQEILARVRQKVDAARQRGEAVDYLTFVPDGEPTLDAQLGAEIRALRELGIGIAVITNASLLNDPNVRADLAHADWVSVKVDTVDPRTWRRVNRPHRTARLEEITAGIERFAHEFAGTLVSETMLVSEMNDRDDMLRATARFISGLDVERAYLSVPIRPPARVSVRAPDERTLTAAYAVFSEEVGAAELLIGYEGDAFAASGDAAADLLSITAVHPMKEQAVRTLLERDGADWNTVRRLLDSGQLVETRYSGDRFFARRLDVGPKRA
jgi:wyosine [tRNA(Phe)-imidazoG37] synthetase (radical SAM superfamily)